MLTLIDTVSTSIWREYYRAPNEEKFRHHVTPPKTENGIRTIPMIPELEEILQAEYHRQEREGFCTAIFDGYSGFVFIKPKTNAAVAYIDVQRMLVNICEHYNTIETAKAKRENREPNLLPKITAHVLRHTFASRLAESDMINLKLLQTLLGHAKVSTTMDIYAEYGNEKKKHEQVNKLHGALRIT